MRLGDSARVARVRVAQCRARKGGRESGVFRLERFFHHARCSAEDERDKNDDVPYKRKGIHFMSNLQATVALDVPASFKPPCKSK